MACVSPHKRAGSQTPKRQDCRSVIIRPLAVPEKEKSRDEMGVPCRMRRSDSGLPVECAIDCTWQRNNIGSACVKTITDKELAERLRQALQILDHGMPASKRGLNIYEMVIRVLDTGVRVLDDQEFRTTANDNPDSR
jgi:hypothetical protein